MRQISLRQEAGRLGGIGSCGRELCCATWLTDFKSVTTATARYQNLSLNPSKLSGQCGRLKCCLNYELDTYLDALTDLPKLKGPLLTKKGAAKLQKTDIFRKILWFGYEKENSWHPVSSERVKEIMALNARDIIPDTLEYDEGKNGKSDFTAINKELERIDKKYRSRKRGKRKKKPRSNNKS
jgi:cell fate regulator YaaT (PSP1 superfamily)